MFLYGEYVDCLEQGKSYLFKNLRLRIVNNKVFLNTPKAKKFIYEETKEIPNLVGISDQTDRTQTSMIGKIVGVSVIIQSHYCSVCGKKGLLKYKIFCCKSCEIKVSCREVTSMWSLKLAVRDVSTNQQHLLYFNNDVAHDLSNILCFELSDEDEIASSLFNDQLPAVKIDFDIVSKSVNNVTAVV